MIDRAAEADSYGRVLRRVAAELRPTSATEFEHAPAAECREEYADPCAVRTVTAPNSPASITRSLSGFLYNHYYLGETCPEAMARRMDLTTPIVLREDQAFGSRLRKANRGKGYAENGWRVLASESGSWVVRRNGISLRTRIKDIAGDPPGAAGEPVTLRFPNERPYVYPDYYMAIGNGGPVSHDLQKTIVRIYFNIAPEGAPGLLETLTSTMGFALERFSVKVLNHPDSYPRPDALVAYLLRDDFPRARPMLDEAAQMFRTNLGTRVPAFTWRVAPGVSLAEEPVTGVSTSVSFGQHRCGLIARGIFDAFASGEDNPAARFRCIVRRFENAGLDPARPYLNAGSKGFP